ncbi:MAG TPA: stage II sporulation protein M [Stellaceae bacterium]|nr:stage II sporulation protein M [Stellaceae bacterium]
MSEGIKSVAFRKGREASWQTLEALIRRIERRGMRSLKADELQSLPLLYRSTLSALSVARAIALDRALVLYLENLSLRAFLVVYGPRLGLVAGLCQYFVRDFPAAVRAARWHVLLAFLTTFAGIIAGFLLVQADPSWFHTLVPGGLAEGRGPNSTRESLLNDEIFGHSATSFRQAIVFFANFLFQHNTTVGLLQFSLGIVGGVPTLLLLLYQGLTLGAFIEIHTARGLTVEFLGWLSIHGVTEITAITLCGAGGLYIADAFLFPGLYSRAENLRLKGRRAGEIMIGAMIMFFIAALLEGGLRQWVASTPGRYTIGGLTALAWLLYFVRSGRAAP